MKGLHILQVTNRIPWPLNDGGNIATFNATKYLHSAGHKVELACLNTNKHHQDPNVIQDVDAIHAVDIDTTVTVQGALLGLFRSTPYNIARFWSDEFASLLSELLQRGKFDLVQLEGSYMGLYSEVIRQASNAKLILRSHNVEYQIWHRLASNERNPLKRWYLQNLTQKIRNWEMSHLQQCDAIIPIATQDERYYRENGFRKPIRTIGGGVDLSRFSPTKPLTFNYKVGFLGSLEWMPNVQGLRWFVNEVWGKVLGLNPQLELHVAGKNPPAELESWTVPGMFFHGMVPDAAAFMESCHFFIVPLLSGGGMRIKVIEAMAMGRCVVSTSVGAEGIEIQTDPQKGAELLIADDAQEWIAVFDRLLTSRIESLSVANRAEQAARSRFGVEEMGAAFESFYEEVLR